MSTTAPSTAISNGCGASSARGTRNSTRSTPSRESVTATVKPDAPGRTRERRLSLLPGSRLGRLIVVLNLAGLMILIVGALVLNELSRGLINAKIDSLTTQGEAIANVIDQAATRGDPAPEMDPD